MRWNDLLTLWVSLAAPLVLAQSPGVAPAGPSTSPTTQPLAINLDLDAVAAEDAFDALARQSGIEIKAVNLQIWANADPVALHIRDGRFWRVLMDLCRQSKVTFLDYSEGPRGRSVALTAVGSSGRDLTHLQVAEADGYLLIPTHCSRNGTLAYDRPAAATNALNVQLRVLSDPGVGGFSLAALPIIEEAVDENGKSLLPSRPLGGGGGQPGSLSQMVTLRLACPPDVGRKVARLKGNLRLNAAVQNEVIELDSPLASPTLKRQLRESSLYVYPLKLSPSSDKDAAKTYQLSLAFRTREGSATGGVVRRYESKEFQAMTLGIVLTDAQQRRFQAVKSSIGGDGYANFEYVIDFLAPTRDSEPARLSWKVPSQSRSTVVPFHFRDLPIP